MDSPADRPRSAAHQCQPVLVHRMRRQRGSHPVRAGAFIGLGRAASRAAGLRGLRRGRDGPQAGSRPTRRALDRVRAGQALPGDGRSRSMGGGSATLLQAAAVTEELSLRALSRATLARQYLLDRVPARGLAAVEHLAGLQSQAPLAPYIGLWAR